MSCKHLKLMLLHNRRPSAVFSFELQQQFGQELKSFNDEITHLQDRLHEVLNPVQPPPPPANLSSVLETVYDRRLKISTWNCQGLYSASLYICQLIQDGCDIIAMAILALLTSEHPPRL